MKKKMVSILTAAFCVSALLAGCGFADTAKTSASSAGAASSSADGTTTFTVGFDAEYPHRLNNPENLFQHKKVSETVSRFCFFPSSETLIFLFWITIYKPLLHGC